MAIHTQVKWLRVILDEGNLLAMDIAMSRMLQTARSLLAERRWVVTGALRSPLLLLLTSPCPCHTSCVNRHCPASSYTTTFSEVSLVL